MSDEWSRQWYYNQNSFASSIPTVPPESAYPYGVPGNASVAFPGQWDYTWPNNYAPPNNYALTSTSPHLQDGIYEPVVNVVNPNIYGHYQDNSSYQTSVPSPVPVNYGNQSLNGLDPNCQMATGSVYSTMTCTSTELEALRSYSSDRKYPRSRSRCRRSRSRSKRRSKSRIIRSRSRSKRRSRSIKRRSRSCSKRRSRSIRRSKSRIRKSQSLIRISKSRIRRSKSRIRRSKSRRRSKIRIRSKSRIKSISRSKRRSRSLSKKRYRSVVRSPIKPNSRHSSKSSQRSKFRSGDRNSKRLKIDCDKKPRSTVDQCHEKNTKIPRVDQCHEKNTKIPSYSQDSNLQTPVNERDAILKQWKNNYCDTQQKISEKLEEYNKKVDEIICAERKIWTRSTPSELYYERDETNFKILKGTEKLVDMCTKFKDNLVGRAEKVNSLKTKYEPPPRRNRARMCKHKTEVGSSSDSDSSNDSFSDEDDYCMEELQRKQKHPDRLDPEMWYNDPGEMNDGPLCRCSYKSRKSGMRHGIYPGETPVPKCSLYSNNADKLYHYRIIISPPTNFLIKAPTIIQHDEHEYIFEGFSILSHFPLPKLPPCKVIRFNIEYTILYYDEKYPENFTIAETDLFSMFLFREILELVDLDLVAPLDSEHCSQFHFMPRFVRELPDQGKEILCMQHVVKYLLDSSVPLIQSSDLEGMVKMSQYEWQNFADELKGMVVTYPGKKPSSVRVDQLDRNIDLQKGDDYKFPEIVHFGIRPPQLSYAGNPDYQKAWREYVKFRHLIANMSKPTFDDKRKLETKENKLQEMRTQGQMKRDVTVAVSAEGFYRTGIMCDIVQHAMLMPVLVCHLRFHNALSILEQSLEYRFQNRGLLQLALTHPSYRENFGTNPDHARNSLTNCGIRQPEYGDRRIHYMNTRKRGINTLINIMSRFGKKEETESNITHNERLEFLGDAVVEFLSSIHLFFSFPELEEGGLATYRAAIVQNQHLALLARVLKLDQFMLYAHGSDLCHDLELKHAMANCFEALMGALFLDGGIDVADRVFSNTLFKDDSELLRVWVNLPPHPLQEQEPTGDRHWIEKFDILNKLTEFEQSINVEFNHIRLLARAFTDRSVGYTNLTMGSNQRLEFLGDTVLQLIASEYLYRFFPEHHEGHLSLLRSSLVNNRTQAVVCDDLGMSQYALYSNPKPELKTKDRADLLEAFIGALYVDQGMEHCEVFCQVTLFPRLQDFIMNQDWNDPKSKLQQCCLTLRTMDGGEPDIPVYKVIECKGPTNTRVYTVAVYFRGTRLASAMGHSIQQAEMNAAKNALEISHDLFPQLDHQKRVIAKSMKRQKRHKTTSQPKYQRDTKSPESYSRYRFRTKSPIPTSSKRDDKKNYRDSRSSNKTSVSLSKTYTPASSASDKEKTRQNSFDKKRKRWLDKSSDMESISKSSSSDGSSSEEDEVYIPSNINFRKLVDVNYYASTSKGIHLTERSLTPEIVNYSSEESEGMSNTEKTTIVSDTELSKKLNIESSGIGGKSNNEDFCILNDPEPSLITDDSDNDSYHEIVITNNCINEGREEAKNMSYIEKVVSVSEPERSKIQTIESSNVGEISNIEKVCINETEPSLISVDSDDMSYNTSDSEGPINLTEISRTSKIINCMTDCRDESESMSNIVKYAIISDTESNRVGRTSNIENVCVLNETTSSLMSVDNDDISCNTSDSEGPLNLTEISPTSKIINCMTDCRDESESMSNIVKYAIISDTKSNSVGSTSNMENVCVLNETASSFMSVDSVDIIYNTSASEGLINLTEISPTSKINNCMSDGRDESESISNIVKVAIFSDTECSKKQIVESRGVGETSNTENVCIVSEINDPLMTAVSNDISYNTNDGKRILDLTQICTTSNIVNCMNDEKDDSENISNIEKVVITSDTEPSKNQSIESSTVVEISNMENSFNLSSDNNSFITSASKSITNLIKIGPTLNIINCLTNDSDKSESVSNIVKVAMISGTESSEKPIIEASSVGEKSSIANRCIIDKTKPSLMSVDSDDICYNASASNLTDICPTSNFFNKMNDRKDELENILNIQKIAIISNTEPNQKQTIEFNSVVENIENVCILNETEPSLIRVDSDEIIINPTEICPTSKIINCITDGTNESEYISNNVKVAIVSDTESSKKQTIEFSSVGEISNIKNVCILNETKPLLLGIDSDDISFNTRASKAIITPTKICQSSKIINCMTDGRNESENMSNIAKVTIVSDTESRQKQTIESRTVGEISNIENVCILNEPLLISFDIDDISHNTSASEGLINLTDICPTNIVKVAIVSHTETSQKQTIDSSSVGEIPNIENVCILNETEPSLMSVYNDDIGYNRSASKSTINLTDVCPTSKIVNCINDESNDSENISNIEKVDIVRGTEPSEKQNIDSVGVGEISNIENLFILNRTEPSLMSVNCDDISFNASASKSIINPTEICVTSKMINCMTDSRDESESMSNIVKVAIVSDTSKKAPIESNRVGEISNIDNVCILNKTEPSLISVDINDIKYTTSARKFMINPTEICQTTGIINCMNDGRDESENMSNIVKSAIVSVAEPSKKQILKPSSLGKILNSEDVCILNDTKSLLKTVDSDNFSFKTSSSKRIMNVTDICSTTESNYINDGKDDSYNMSNIVKVGLVSDTEPSKKQPIESCSLGEISNTENVCILKDLEPPLIINDIDYAIRNNSTSKNMMNITDICPTSEIINCMNDRKYESKNVSNIVKVAIVSNTEPSKKQTIESSSVGEICNIKNVCILNDTEPSLMTDDSDNINYNTSTSKCLMNLAKISSIPKIVDCINDKRDESENISNTGEVSIVRETEPLLIQGDCNTNSSESNRVERTTNIEEVIPNDANIS